MKQVAPDGALDYLFGDLIYKQFRSYGEAPTTAQHSIESRRDDLFVALLSINDH